jgi:hypothetical protein
VLALKKLRARCDDRRLPPLRRTTFIMPSADAASAYAAPEQQSGDDWRARLVIILSMGMRPCSGAIMVLLFSKVIGVFNWGMAAALAMAAGTSLTISGWRCWFMVSASWPLSSAAIRRHRCGNTLVGRRWHWPGG